MKFDMAHENAKRISEALQTPGGHLSVGRGGYTLYFNGSSRLQGYDCDQMREACVARGLPVIDSRTVPFDVVWDLAVKGPMVAVGRAADVAPWGLFPARRFRPSLTHIAQQVPKSSTCPKRAFWNPMRRALNTKP
jgi:hypothetical protein